MKALDISVVKSPRTYEVEPSRSVLEVRMGGHITPTSSGKLGELSGNVIFDDEDPSRCLIRLWINSVPPIRFYSWRFKRIAHENYWVPGALTIHGFTVFASLRVQGPIAEVADGQGHVRSVAVASAKVRADQIGLKPSTTEVILRFEIGLVRRIPAEDGGLAA
jgi:hypothetical protein